MNKVFEFTGKTTQEALDAGLKELNLSLADVKWEVLQEGAKGLFGLFGSKPAKVRIEIKDEEEDDGGMSDLISSLSIDSPKEQKKKNQPVKKEAKPVKPEVPREVPKTELPKAEPKAEAVKPAAPKTEVLPAEEMTKAEPAPEKKAQKEAGKPEKKQEKSRQPKKEAAQKPQPVAKPENSEKPAEEKDISVPMKPAEPFVVTEPPVIYNEDTPAGKAQRFLMDISERMGVKVDVYVDDSEEGILMIHMVGDTMGVLIGHRGETLDALQYLTSLQVNKGRDGYIRVTLDTENYRAKREESLRRLAVRMANRAVKTGRRVVMEPMNPYERRVLHTALQDHPAVTTHSEGDEPNRRVVITLQVQPEKEAQSDAQKTAVKEAAKDSRKRKRSRHRRGPRKKTENQPAAETAEVEAPVVETEIENLGGEE